MGLRRKEPGCCQKLLRCQDIHFLLLIAHWVSSSVPYITQNRVGLGLQRKLKEASQDIS